jgi:hypothetical protein
VRVFGRFRAFLWRWIVILLPVAVVILTAASGVTGDRAQGTAQDGQRRVWNIFGHKVTLAWTLIGIAGALALMEAAIVAHRQVALRSAKELANRAQTAEAGLLQVMRGELVRLQEEAGYLSNERVSLFRCEGDCFVLVARRSLRPAFDESLGREAYPLGQGCLGRAWDEATAEEPGLPEPGPDSGPPRRGWLKEQDRLWRVPQATATSFTMRSQSYAAFRIQPGERALGVIVFESTLSSVQASVSGGARLLGVAELKPIVNRYSERMAQLLQAVEPIPRERIRRYLEVQQGRAAKGKT